MGTRRRRRRTSTESRAEAPFENNDVTARPASRFFVSYESPRAREESIGAALLRRPFRSEARFHAHQSAAETAAALDRRAQWPHCGACNVSSAFATRNREIAMFINARYIVVEPLVRSLNVSLNAEQRR